MNVLFAFAQLEILLDHRYDNIVISEKELTTINIINGVIHRLMR